MCGLFYFRISVYQEGGKPVSLPVGGGDKERTGKTHVGNEEEMGVVAG